MIRILTADNTTYSMNDVPDQVDGLRYCVLDYSNQDEVDYYFLPLAYLESFSSPAADLQIGPYRVQMPLDWSIVIGEKDHGEIEIINLMSLCDRGFDAFAFNPIDGYMPDFLPVEIVNVYPDVKWFFPKLKFGHLLTVPLRNQLEVPSRKDGTRGSLCSFFVREAGKIPEALDIRKLI
jgi:hypothetical protein